MVESFEEFADEMKSLRNELKEKGGKADTKLILSWLDRLTISLESLASSLDLLAQEVDELSKK